MSTITKSQLLDMAKSKDSATRRQAFEIYQAWVKAMPRLAPQDQISTTERIIFDQIFAGKK